METPMKTVSVRPALLFLIAGSVGLLLSCGTSHESTRLQKGIDSLGLQIVQLRLNNVQHVMRISLLIDAAADSILRASQDQDVRRKAHQWRIFAVPAFRQALLFSDPAGATLDGWTCSVQMRQFFTVGRGSAFFGDQQPIAIRTSEKIESIFMSYDGDSSYVERFKTVEGKLEDWASEHPIEGSFYDRTSIIPYMKQFHVDLDEGAFGSIEALAADVRSLSTNINLLAAQVPREARWHGEYLLSELGAEDRLNMLEADVTSMTGVLARMIALLEQGDLTIDIKALQTLHGDFLRLEQRLAEERELILNDVNRQRIETLARTEAMVERSLAFTQSNATGLIDHLVWRVAQLLMAAAVAVALFVGVMVMLKKAA